MKKRINTFIYNSMKKFFCNIFSLIIAIGFCLMALCSCSESEEKEDIDPDDPTPNYLVMLYGVGGGNLDDGIIANIAQALDEGGSSKVKMTFQYKASAKFHASQLVQGYHGTLRFTGDDNAHLKGKFKSVSKEYPFLDENSLLYYNKELKTEKFADEKYNMSCPEGLADFIKWSKSKYPDAKRTILIITDHGGGWDMAEDGLADTRAILFDDNLDSKSLSLQNVIDGVNNAGGVDMLYTDACLMSMYENIYGYAKCAKYLLSSVEITPSISGDYRKLMSLLKKAGAGDEGLENAIRSYVDYCTSTSWWNMDGDESGNYDLGFYNLSRLGTLTPALKNVASTIASKFVSHESIQPSADDLQFGDQFAGYIRSALSNCQVSYRKHSYYLDKIPESLVTYLRRDNLVVSPKDDDPYVENHKLIEWIRIAPTDNAREAMDKYPEDWKSLVNTIINDTCFSFSITDLLRILDNQLTEVGASNNPFKQLRIDLLDALKDVAYISCTNKKNKPGIDQPYELCSPGVFIAPLNAEYYELEKNPISDKVPSSQQALSIYQSTYFDKEVGWSNVLKVIDVMPSVLFNPNREAVK